ncbi:ABC transporter permease [Cellulomonas bogoriensis]|uniref:ABC transporter permease n=1 Tax=Cellulomonas bogoriensis 69B4 = DSM 16987 TaxID=1386082 RepID=A0A0A0BUM8_9CELL|nr:ABC transporter permease [Cellulomonas bogoriensis]KGM11397.1 ABC transporter permease [Cellulomonas bogoriensis 69B4 = DSM 16987]
MSAADGAVGMTWRLFTSELRLIYTRRRNLAGAVVLAAVPVIIAIAIKVDGGGGGSFLFGQIPVNGLFVALAALMVQMPFFLPTAVAVIAGDSVAGEANVGTLRYLLVVPVERTRLLVVKFAAMVVFAASATLLVAGVGSAVGVALFGTGPLPTLSGPALTFGEGVGRVLLVCAYLTLCLVAIGSIGLFISTLTEQPLGATIGLLVVVLTSQILDAIPQLSVIHEYLPTHWWLAFADLLRDPVSLDTVTPGVLSALAYTAIFTTAAWARLTTKDITS